MTALGEELREEEEDGRGHYSVEDLSRGREHAQNQGRDQGWPLITDTVTDTVTHTVTDTSGVGRAACMWHVYMCICVYVYICIYVYITWNPNILQKHESSLPPKV